MSDGQQNGIVNELINKAAAVDYSIRLPDSEYEVMTAVWEGEPPMTTAFLMQQIGTKKGWKAPTLISFLTRLEERGFIASFKKGKERFYMPLADREKYLHSVTEQFVNLYHDGSFVRFMDSLFLSRKFDDKEADELLAWLRQRY
ncbi:MAG: BlaI/MecI/CopY family transcriptional regulator [Ruminococcaceae bacterium]|nr:BlaI/MecI/CopY family transcriptional regulator [Oscillospiraceae bacterium]